MGLWNWGCIALKRSLILRMSAPRACYSSLALLTRENCAGATLSVAVSRMNTTLGCSGMNGRDRRKAMKELIDTVTVQADFDRIALLSKQDADEGWNHNNHYHRFLLEQVPACCAYALDIGCGT